MLTFQGMISGLVLAAIVLSSFHIDTHIDVCACMQLHVCMCCPRFSKTRKQEAATSLSA